jgi:hypothetical protein
MTVRAILVRAVAGLCILSLSLAGTAVLAPLASAAGALDQNVPTSGTVDVSGSAAFTDNLSATSVPNPADPVTFTTTSSLDGLIVSSSGAVSTTGTLAAGPYTVSGTDSDVDLDSGTWTYTLTVSADNIVQGPPTSNIVTVAGSATFTDTLTAASGNVGPVTYLTTSPSPGLTVAGGGGITTHRHVGRGALHRLGHRQ